MVLKFFVAAIFMSIGFFGSYASVGAAKLKLVPQLVSRGTIVYARECAVCHGPSGKGDGEGAYLLFPRPRDLTSKMFKIRTTLPGEPPNRSDIVRTLTLGLPGSTMPSFVSLGESDRRAVAEYVLSLAGFEDAAEEFVELPKFPPVSKEWIAKGKAAFKKYECAKCHGEKGKGDGPSASSLKDYKGRPIRARDYTRGVFKGGGDIRSIATRILTGMEGTPMPSYSDTVEPNDLIALAHFVRQSSKGRDFWQPGTGVIPARRIQNVPTSPNDVRWTRVVPTVIPMMQLFNDGRPSLEVEVRAIHSEREISFRLEWADATPDRKILTGESFVDAAAVQFSIREKDPPLFVMGAPDNLVNIWYWNATLGRKPAGLEAKYPGMVVDDYPFTGVAYQQRQIGHQRIPSARMTKRLFIAAWAAGNPTTTPGRARAIMDINAAGFGTLDPQGPEGQNVVGSGRWEKGRWRVVFTRTLRSAEENDAKLLPGTVHPIAFAVWDGSHRDRDGQKSVTTWYKLRIE